MSDQDDALLDEDLGDEEYDLGNDEEEALLADDYEIDRQNNYKGEEETDDVLDLGVTDALDDLEGEDENVEYRNETVSHNQSHIYNDDSVNCHGTYYEQEEHGSYIEESIHDPSIQQNPSQIPLGDLREKLQKNNVNSQRIAGNGGGPGTEDDECEEARERRNRFQPERTIIPPKMNLKIPDSLENVVTMEHARPPAFRGRGRGRGVRGIRGGRFPTQGNYNPRFSGRNPYEDQNPQFRPPLIENRPPLFPTGLPMMNHQMINPQMYHPGHQQPPPPRFQQYPQNHPPHGPPGGQHFPEPGVRPAFNQFQGMPGPRIPAPRMDYHPRPPGPRFNGPPNQLPYMQPQPPHYSGPRPPLEGPPLHHHEQMSANHAGIHQQRPMGPPQGPPMHPGHQMHLQERPNGMMPPNFPRAPGPAQGPPIPHHPGSQPRQNFENRPPFPEQSFDGRNVYEMKPGFNNPPGVNQFNSGPGPAGQQPAAPVIPNVPLPPGHKILINPHFRGNPQPPLDAIGRPWDNSQSQTPSDSFGQSSNPAYQDSYNQPPVSQASQDYQKNYPQTKSDDPYAYFSDVWQENKTSKKSSISPLKSLGESNYSRDSNYRDYDNKYKSDSRDKYEEPRYRERTPPRSRDYSPKSRPHHSDSYSDHSRKPVDSNRTQSRTPHKRTPEPTDKSREISPKRFKSTNRNSQDTESNNFVKNTREEDVDPEMREYRKKMEEQKRLREKLLQEKENRRKKAALEKIDETKDQKTADNIQDIKDASAVAGVKKVPSENPGQVPVKRTRTAAGNTQATEGGEKTNVRIVRTVQATEKKTADINVRETAENITDAQKKVLTQTNTRRIVIQKPTASVQRVVASIQKTNSSVKAVSAAQKTQAVQKTGTPKKAVSSPLKKTAAVQKPAAAVKKVTAVEKSQVTSNKTSAQKAPHKAVAVAKNPVSNQRTIAGNIRKVIVSTASANAKKVTASSQNNQRIVLQPNSTKPTTVIIENLAASTTEAQIRSMCQGIGTLESIIMGDSTATIVFKTHSAAMVFHNKFQRKMIDLSMINVRLVSKASVSNKPTNTAVKK